MHTYRHTPDTNSQPRYESLSKQVQSWVNSQEASSPRQIYRRSTKPIYLMLELDHLLLCLANVGPACMGVCM
jgi:hypothetical protein